MSSAQFEHIQRVRQDFHGGSKRLKDSLNHSIKTLAHDLYNKHTHFIFELIQNAEDNAYKKQGTYPPYISFQFTKTDPTCTPGSNGALIIQNNEIGFQSDNVDAICEVGKTTKKKEQGYIGEKGIGFKSVFRVTGNPHIFSNGYHFCLPECDEETDLGYIVPQWIDTIPEGLNLSETYIILPLTKPDFGYEKIEKMLRDIEPEVILFLSTLEEIRVKTDTGDNLTILKDSADIPEVVVIVEGNMQGKVFSNSDSFLVYTKRFDKPEHIYHEKRDGIKNRDVSIAFPLDENSAAAGKIFAYLPVRSDTGFPFLINADFILPSSREDIQGVSWNHWLMKCVATVITSGLLPLLKERQLLGVRFLERLANRLNNLAHDKASLFYPIFTRICEVLKNEPLLPTSNDEFVSARNAALTRSDAVRNLITPAQLGILLRSHVDRNVPLKWLSAEITLDRAPYLRRYLMEILGIEEVTPDMFARRLSKDLLDAQSDEWFVKFYQFLLDQPALWRSSGGILRTKPILRLQDGTHVNPYQEGSRPTAYLSVRARTATSVPIVKWEISQDEDAYRFLKALGVQECDIVAEVIETILPKYESGSTTISINEHLSDFAKIERAYKTDSREKKSQLQDVLRKTRFILAKSPNTDSPIYLRPDQLYFGTDELRMYFDGNNLVNWTEIWKQNNSDVNFWSDSFKFGIPDGPTGAFVSLDKYPTTARKLFEDLEILHSVQIQRRTADSQGYVTIVSQKGNNKRGLDGFDPDIQVDGLRSALDKPTLEKSAFIWNHIAIPNADCIKGTVEKSTRKDFTNRSSEDHISDSFGQLLIDTAWLPDSDGKMHKPVDIPLDDLHPSFKKDEQLGKQLGMPLSKARIVDGVAPDLGVSSDILNGIVNASPETLQQIASLLRLGPDPDHLLPSPSSRQATTFPVSSVSNPAQRKERILADLKEAPDQEYVEKVRSVRTTRSEIDPKTSLRTQYMNDDGQVICQICQEEMPFKYRGENYYFDAVEMLKGYFTKEYEAQFLALCPECSPKYRTFVKQVPAAMDALKKQLMDSDDAGDFEVPLKLGDTNTSLRFVERHWLDIKAILSFYEDQSKQTIETADSGKNRVESKGSSTTQPDPKKENWDADQILSQFFARPVRFITYTGIKDLAEVEASQYGIKGIDTKGAKIKFTKLDLLFAFPKEKMPALKPNVKIRRPLKNRNLQPVEIYENRFQVADKLLREVKENRSKVEVVTRTGHVLSGWIQHFDKHVLYMRVAEKVVIVYRHGLFGFTIGKK